MFIKSLAAASVLALTSSTAFAADTPRTKVPETGVKGNDSGVKGLDLGKTGNDSGKRGLDRGKTGNDTGKAGLDTGKGGNDGGSVGTASFSRQSAVSQHIITSQERRTPRRTERRTTRGD